MNNTEKIRRFFSGDNYALINTGITIDQTGTGFAECSFTVAPSHLNSDGVVQGGALFTLADFCAAAAANATGLCAPDTPLDSSGNPAPEHVFVTRSVQITYLRPAMGIGVRFQARARLIQSGRSTALLNVVIMDPSGKEVAYATVDSHKKRRT